MSGYSIADLVHALDAGLEVDGDFNTGVVTIKGGDQEFRFDNAKDTRQALELCSWVVLHKMVKAGRSA